MKKLFALLLVAIMALSMVACGADKTKPPRLTLPPLPLPLRRRRPCPTSL